MAIDKGMELKDIREGVNNGCATDTRSESTGTAERTLYQSERRPVSGS